MATPKHSRKITGTDYRSMSVTRDEQHIVQIFNAAGFALGEVKRVQAGSGVHVGWLEVNAGYDGERWHSLAEAARALEARAL